MLFNYPSSQNSLGLAIEEKKKTKKVLITRPPRSDELGLLNVFIREPERGPGAQHPALAHEMA